jgi:hypothetical protein
MGYKRDKIYRLVFEDPELEGLEVRARSVAIGKLLQISELKELRNSGELDGDGIAKTRDLLQIFADALVSWNLEIDTAVNGEVITQPVPATLDGLLSQDLGFVLQIIEAWMEAVTSVSKSLGKASPSGVTFPEGSLPMEPLSSDLPTLVAQSYS